MRRTTLTVVLATGALAVPAVAFAAGGDDPATQTQQTPQTAPVQQQPDQQRPDRGDCPEHDGSGGGGSSGDSSGSGDTLL